MKVILKQDVRGLGKKGDMVKASDGYARNYLCPKDLAAPADAQNVTEMKNAQNSKQFKYDTEKAAAEADAKKLEGSVLEMKAKAGVNGKLFGSVTAKEIAEKIKQDYGITVNKRKIKVAEIKAFGTYDAEVRLFQGVSATVKVRVSEQ